MEYETYTTDSVAEKLHLTREVVRWRGKQLGIKSRGTGKKITYSWDDVERIMNYQRKKYVCNKIELKTRFEVVQVYLSMSENSIKNVSEATGINFSTVNYILTEYFKNDKTIIVESKINQL